jgi:hypothetical protein
VHCTELLHTLYCNAAGLWRGPRGNKLLNSVKVLCNNAKTCYQYCITIDRQVCLVCEHIWWPTEGSQMPLLILPWVGSHHASLPPHYHPGSKNTPPPLKENRITRHIQFWSADLQEDVDKLDVLTASGTIRDLSLLMTSLTSQASGDFVVAVPRLVNLATTSQLSTEGSNSYSIRD